MNTALGMSHAGSVGSGGIRRLARGPALGLGLVVTRDGGIPLAWHGYAGDRPDVTQFPLMTAQLKSRYEAVRAAAGLSAGVADMTVVFDAGKNIETTRRARRHPGARQDPPHPGQGRSRDHRDHRERLGQEVIRWQLSGGQPRDLRLTWHIDENAAAALEEEIFGKHVLITSHDDWTVPDVVARLTFGLQSHRETGVTGSPRPPSCPIRAPARTAEPPAPWVISRGCDHPTDEEG